MYEVAALCDIDAGRGRAVAEKFGIPAVVGSLDALLERDLDIVDICTPSGLHQAQAVAVLAAGRHAVVEKPVGKSLAEMDAVAAAEAGSRGRVCPIFQYRFGHGLQKLAHLRRKGYAAKASVATAETHWLRGAAYYGQAAWRGTFDGELGGCLTTHAIHIHDILCEVLGPVASVHARTSRRLNRNETEDMGVLSLAFASGAFATSSVTLGLAAGDVAAAGSSSTIWWRRAGSRLTTRGTIPGSFPTTIPPRRRGSMRRWRTSRRCRSASWGSSTGCTGR